MNPKNLFALDFAKSSIVASATTLRKARNPESPECKALMRMLSEHPSFHVAEKEIRKKSGKQTYKGLTFQAMTDYIKTQANSEAEIRKYEVVRRIAKIKGSEYALTKKWFLNAYPAYKEKAIVEQEMDEMLRQDTEELNAGAYILRYTNIISNRFDTTTFKRLYADLYKDFTKAVSSRRFTVSC